jgi:hypothetical protein
MPTVQFASLSADQIARRDAMAAVPSVKGAVLEIEVEAVRKLVAAGGISRAELERRLQPEDLALLDRPVFASGWYNIGILTRFIELLRDVEGDGSNEYLLRHGAQLVSGMIRSRLYQQLDYLKTTQLEKATEAHERFLAFGRDLRRLTSLSASVYNFSRWQTVVDEEFGDRYVLEISEAAPFPPVWLWLNQGGINRMAEEHGTRNLWRWERPRPDLIRYRMDRPV